MHHVLIIELARARQADRVRSAARHAATRHATFVPRPAAHLRAPTANEDG